MPWDRARERALEPPYRPELSGPEDTSLFDKYPESTEASAPVVKNEQDLFARFEPWSATYDHAPQPTPW